MIARYSFQSISGSSNLTYSHQYNKRNKNIDIYNILVCEFYDTNR